MEDLALYFDLHCATLISHLHVHCLLVRYEEVVYFRKNLSSFFLLQNFTLFSQCVQFLVQLQTLMLFLSLLAL